MTPSPTASTPLDLSDIVPFADLIRECEKKGIATKGQLTWWARYRHENGLTSSGALVEKRANPRSKRPMLFVVRPRFIDWLANGHQAAA
ncbi:hypothetical protein [Thiorhodococcus minor]|uniref:Uncharacterized protein n=1 Tax=Thiorhodococcus minor TaxID=57489 RepID=A0A6M0JVV5_9GAMM|nr:hypothetical protein [Thiorhodococcus minor]NEV61650.1 hypothetical protein [Thiorhodococcus minor]